ncbi:MAG: class I SAM-dependent methyltransferase, partial [Pseudomonadota bacterium]
RYGEIEVDYTIELPYEYPLYTPADLPEEYPFYFGDDYELGEQDYPYQSHDNQPEFIILPDPNKDPNIGKPLIIEPSPEREDENKKQIIRSFEIIASGENEGDSEVIDNENQDIGNVEHTEKSTQGSSGMLERKLDTDTVQKWDEKLKFQVEVSFDRQYNFMMENGLDECDEILDVGTGNGYFLGLLAVNKPYVSFTGLDSNETMLGRAEDIVQGLGVDNVTLLSGDIDQDPFGDKEPQFDGILLRYTDVHISDFEHTLSILSKYLKPGGRIWIFSVEIDNMGSTPEHEVYKLYIEGIQRFYHTFGIDGHRATILTSLLDIAGFSEVVSVPDLISTKDLGAKMFGDFMINQAEVFRHFDSTSFSEEDVEIIRDFAHTYLSSQEFNGTHGAVMVTAVKSE